MVINMKRYGQVIGVAPEQVDEYIRHHEQSWPEVCEMIAECNIHNYSIYYRGNLLFSYFEYTGVDFAADMKKMGDDPVTQEWWKVVGKAQRPMEDRAPGEWWAEMQEIFHQD
jgi:L-rhamnose mutarotase